MKIRGRFKVNCDPEKTFEVLAQACGELKAKMHDIDTLRHRIDGNSKTTAQRWGTKFHARVIKHFLATRVEVYDIALVTDNRVIKESHKRFTKYQSA